jgi:hypothetical protein
MLSSIAIEFDDANEAMFAQVGWNCFVFVLVLNVVARKECVGTML